MSILEVSSGADVDPVLIEQALESVLRGPSFRSSKQCQALLQYIVKHSVSGEPNMLRERVIGAEVFGRAPDYDTGNDPIVRSRAAEVRKRLAQHYVHDDETQHSVRIEIPSGSYHATFEIRPPRSVRGELESLTVQAAETPMGTASFVSFAPVMEELKLAQARSAPVSRWTGWRVGLIAVAIVMLAGIGIFSSIDAQREGAYNRFWGPVADSSKPVVVYFGGTYSYHISSDFLDAYHSAHPEEKVSTAATDEIKSGDMLTESSLVPDNSKTGYGDVAAVARMASTLTRMGSRYDLRYGSDIAATDFRNSATVLIGGFSNVWSLQLMRGFPYVLEQGGIVDGQTHKLVWRQSVSEGGEKNEDYALISRIPSAATGNFTLIIAGINTFSNQGAADFISSPERLRALAHSLKPGWENRNLEIVLHVSVIQQVPVTSDVVAIRSW
ncbi:MAG TPA: hypothetical protein VGU46_10745 [Acidobacteriaceae bacterium]|nr:hypothetical protein [Acidobacteriaceae bacterium]